jgi:hypothetical protein
MSHWTTTARKTEEKMVGGRNRPQGLIQEWQMMIYELRLYCTRLG